VRQSGICWGVCLTRRPCFFRAQYRNDNRALWLSYRNAQLLRSSLLLLFERSDLTHYSRQSRSLGTPPGRGSKVPLMQCTREMNGAFLVIAIGPKLK
jgi:hypothetical protein